MPFNIGPADLLVVVFYFLLPIAVIYGIYRLVRFAVRRELDDRDRNNRHNP